MKLLAIQCEGYNVVFGRRRRRLLLWASAKDTARVAKSSVVFSLSSPSLSLSSVGILSFHSLSVAFQQRSIFIASLEYVVWSLGSCRFVLAQGMQRNKLDLKRGQTVNILIGPTDASNSPIANCSKSSDFDNYVTITRKVTRGMHGLTREGQGSLVFGGLQVA